MYHKLSFYKHAADVLKLAKEDGQNVKNILFNDKKYKYMNIKALYALISEALKHWEVLEILIKDSNILVEESKLNVWHVRILITELLFGKKVLDDTNVFVHTILRYENKFKKLLSKEHIQNLSVSNKSNVDIKVLYIKVNTIKESVDSVINILSNEGWQQLATADSYEGYLNQLKELEPGSENFLQDFHIPEVLVFPQRTELHWHDLYQNGSFYFMDKSSCLAPHLLRPHAHSSVLDMCAAPGLKTIHLAALNQSGKVYAVERDDARFKVLTQMVGLSGAENVKLINKDVTKLNLSDFTDVEYVLLDPSCSGSGMRERQPRIELDAPPEDKSRLCKLAGFQLTLLRFALTRFPRAQRVVYSTCSLNIEENEEVIQDALNSKFHDFHLVSAAKHLPEWVSFGSDEFEFGSKCIYSRPETDLTTGFFVAVFERKKYHSKENSEDKEMIENEAVEIKGKRSFYENVDDADDLSKDLIEVALEDKGDHISIKKRKRDRKFEKTFTTNKPDEEVLQNNKVLKKRDHKNVVSDENEDNYSSHKRIKLENNHTLVNNRFETRDNKQSQKGSFKPDEKETNTSNKVTSKKVTKSLKKRLRQRKLKLSSLHTKKEKNVKKCKENINKVSTLCKTSNNKIKSNELKSKNKEDVIKGSVISKAKLRQIRLKKLKLARNSSNDSGTNKSEKKIKKLVAHEQHSQNDDNKTDIVIERKKKKHRKSDAGSNHADPKILEKFENHVSTSDESAAKHKKKDSGKGPEIIDANKLEIASDSPGKKSKKPGKKHTEHQAIKLLYNSESVQDTNPIIITESAKSETIVLHKYKHETELLDDSVPSSTSAVKVKKDKSSDFNLGNIEEVKLDEHKLADDVVDNYRTHNKKKKKRSSGELSVAEENGIEDVSIENYNNILQLDNSNDTTAAEIKSHKKKHKKKKRNVSPEVNKMEEEVDLNKSGSQLLDFADGEKERDKSPKKKHKNILNVMMRFKRKTGK